MIIQSKRKAGSNRRDWSVSLSLSKSPVVGISLGYATRKEDKKREDLRHSVGLWQCQLSSCRLSTTLIPAAKTSKVEKGGERQMDGHTSISQQNGQMLSLKYKRSKWPKSLRLATDRLDLHPGRSRMGILPSSSSSSLVHSGSTAVVLQLMRNYFFSRLPFPAVLCKWMNRRSQNASNPPGTQSNKLDLQTVPYRKWVR